MNTADAVLENTAYHAHLLAQLAELDYLPPALEQQESYIAGLEHQSRQLVAKIASLEMQTKKEQAEHEALRDSTRRRFAATLTGRRGKYEAEASKEEREYVEALETERYHKRQQTTLMNMIHEAKAVRADLQSKLKHHDKAKQDLAELYSKIFDGPTQDFTEDDQLEWQLQAAQSRYNEIQGYLNRESQAVDLLQSANTALQSCASQIQEAISDSHWGGYRPLSDMMERESLDKAREQATRVQMFVQQAMMVSPQVQPIGEIGIAHGSIISDVIFDNIFTDFAFHQKIKASQQNVQDLMNQLGFAQGRLQAIDADLRGAADALSHARGALDAFRRRVFESMSTNGSFPDAHTKHASPSPRPKPGSVSSRLIAR
ncbi:hypothetical protein C8R45DRAFT_841233 [Mycena sanguinolenta]|nr:hypothetical protein C8R45DRAFT_841233 [Mycena sanguinolenta]